MAASRLAPILALVLGGCSLSPIINSAAIDFNQVEENVNNQALVINILRARDHAPLYLAEFQEIRATYTAQIGTGNIVLPFGPGPLKPPTTKLDSASPNASLQMQPSFAIDQLDTQQFTLGMLRPVDPTYWEYYWHREYEPRVLLHTFVHQIGEGDAQYVNTPCAPAWDSKAKCEAYDSFVADVDSLVNGGVFLNVFTRVTPLPDDGAKQSGGANANPERAVIDGQAYAFVRAHPEVAICRGDVDVPSDVRTVELLTQFQVSPCKAAAGATGAPAGLTPRLRHAFECTHSTIVECQASWDDVQKQTEQGQVYELRSVDGVIHYLGEVQRRVDADPGPDDKKKGVTWTEDGQVHTLFQLHREPGADRVAVNYHGGAYYVRQGDATDHTLQVLSLLSQLINANKNANEIPATKAVQIVP